VVRVMQRERKHKQKQPGEICEVAWGWVEGRAGIHRQKNSSHKLNSWKVFVG
ncbi:hypothetical protein HispidOSU_027962, partial [Sigmodon hispidus]